MSHDVRSQGADSVGTAPDQITGVGKSGHTVQAHNTIRSICVHTFASKQASFGRDAAAIKSRPTNPFDRSASYRNKVTSHSTMKRGTEIRCGCKTGSG
jgi:hypothetical protein